MNETEQPVVKAEPPTSAEGKSDAASKPADKKKPPKPPAGEDDLFLLEKLYPEAHQVFQATSALLPNSEEVVIALDTNALHLPYLLGKGDLAELGTVYSKIAGSGRLFLPERVAREFIKHRDRKLADMVQAIDDRISRMSGWDARVSPLLLEGFSDGEALAKCGENLDEATKAYLQVLRRLSAHIKAWRGNDPVTALYAGLFGSGRTIAPTETRDQIIEELDYGLRNKVPPGYKDGNKDDRGIGDVVIWLSLLNLGRTTKKDLIFVTGEQKADWFVRAGNRPLYPRPELVDAYRRASGGRSLRLSSLHELLKDMAAPETLVADVEDAERTANNAIQAATSSVVGAFASSSHTRVSVGQASFDYSTNDGGLRVVSGGHTFDLAFSKHGGSSIYLLKRGNTKRIARVKNVEIGLPTSIDRFDTSSSHYTIHVNEGFLVENDAGAVLAGRIIGILDDTRGPDRDEVAFTYTINESGARVIMP